jgi:mxaJ protein
MVWGPIAGYFVKKKGAPLEVVPIDDPSDPGARFAFDISMGVRKGDKELKEQLEGALARRHDDIVRVLEDFGVPLLPAAAEPAHAKGGH